MFAGIAMIKIKKTLLQTSVRCFEIYSWNHDKDECSNDYDSFSTRSQTCNTLIPENVYILVTSLLLVYTEYIADQ